MISNTQHVTPLSQEIKYHNNFKHVVHYSMNPRLNGKPLISKINKAKFSWKPKIQVSYNPWGQNSQRYKNLQCKNLSMKSKDTTKFKV